MSETTAVATASGASSKAARRTLAILLGGCFFASGAASLTFEALWFRQAGLAFGNSVWASSLVLAGFMAGMAIGNLVAARRGDRMRDPLRAYALLELVVGTTGVLLCYLLPALTGLLAPLERALAGSPAALQILRLTLALGLLLLPAAAMGMTLPLLTRALCRRDPSFGRAFGWLYGANTLGAVAGVAGTELVLVEAFGIRGSGVCALGLCVLAALGAWSIARAAEGNAGAAAHDSAAEAEANATGGDAAGSRGDALPWLVAAFFAGFALLALEVVWLRFLMLFLNDTPLCFAMVLSLVLGGIALGGWLGSLLCGRLPRAVDQAGAIAYAGGIAGLAGYLLYPTFLQRFLRADQDATTVLLVALPLVVPAAVCSGALFTVLGAGLRESGHGDARAAGQLSFANTVGAALGSLCAGFLLLPRAGMEHSLFALFALYGLCGLVLITGPRVSALTRYGATVVFAGCLAFFPFGEMNATYVRASASRWMRKHDQVVAVREGLTGTIVQIDHRFHDLHLFHQLATNAYSMSVDDFAARRYMKLFVILPRAIHPRIERALIIGYGLGNTAQALTETRELEQLDVVDLSRDMIEMARAIPPRSGKHPLSDPRLQLRIEDGRHFLETTERRYDLITGEPPPPIVAGVESLYSREYFELVHSRLAQGGIATYWLPMMNISAATTKAIIAAFCDAFSDCSLWHASARNFMLMGTRDASGPVDEERFTSLFTDPAARPEMISIGFEIPGQLGTLFIGDAEYLRELTADAAPVTDDRPKRMQQDGSAEERERLAWAFRDTKLARDRFERSPLVARLFPEGARRSALANFENQRLMNDLLWPGPSPARQVGVLHQVLQRTPLRLPILLMLQSDPDLQDSLLALGDEARRKPEYAAHIAAGLLSARDYRGALEALRAVPDASLPLPGLREYLQQASEQLAE